MLIPFCERDKPVSINLLLVDGGRRGLRLFLGLLFEVGVTESGDLFDLSTEGSQKVNGVIFHA